MGVFSEHPKKPNRDNRNKKLPARWPITPQVKGLERIFLHLWLASVVLHPNIKFVWVDAAIFSPGRTTMRRHPECSLRACSMEILYTELSGSKNTSYRRQSLPGYLGDLDKCGTVGKPYFRALEQVIVWGCRRKWEEVIDRRRRTPR